MLSNITILRDLVLVEPTTHKRKTTGGFVVPDETGGDVGKVVAVGPKAIGLTVGDVVYFANESKNITIKGTEYIVMEIENVIGIEKD